MIAILGRLEMQLQNNKAFSIRNNIAQSGLKPAPHPGCMLAPKSVSCACAEGSVALCTPSAGTPQLTFAQLTLPQLTFAEVTVQLAAHERRQQARPLKRWTTQQRRFQHWQIYNDHVAARCVLLVGLLASRQQLREGRNTDMSELCNKSGTQAWPRLRPSAEATTKTTAYNLHVRCHHMQYAQGLPLHASRIAEIAKPHGCGNGHPNKRQCPSRLHAFTSAAHAFIPTSACAANRALRLLLGCLSPLLHVLSDRPVHTTASASASA